MLLTVAAIVCALDFSAAAPQMVDCGATLAHYAGARLFLVHAIPDVQDHVHPSALFERGGDLARQRDIARLRIDDLMRQHAVAWEAVLGHGDPVEQITALVADLPSCLVISASQGVSGIRRLFGGTVVERLSRALGVPMLVIRPVVHPPDDAEGQRFTRMVVCCDDQGAWQGQAGILHLLAAAGQPHIHLIHALERPLADASRGVSYDRSQQADQQRLHDGLVTAARRVFPWAATLSVTVAPGQPAEMALQAIHRQSADLVAVGVRRSGRVGRWIAGSTTETLLRQAPCSVLTLPPSAAPGHRPGGRS